MSSRRPIVRQNRRVIVPRTTGASGPSLFNPLSVANCKLWWDAEPSHLILNGSGVQTILDQSGTGDTNKNGVQNTAANQMVWNASDVAYNGRPTLSADTTDFLQSGTWNIRLGASYTCYWVGQFGTNTGTDRIILDSITTGARCALYRNGSNTKIGLFTNGAAETPASVPVGPYIACILVTASQASAYLSSISTTAVSFSTTAASPTGFTLGATYLGTLNAGGKHRSFIVYDGSHDQATRGIVMNALSSETGIYLL